MSGLSWITRGILAESKGDINITNNFILPFELQVTTETKQIQLNLIRTIDIQLNKVTT